jgi:acyl-CoA thioester hydrolase
MLEAVVSPAFIDGNGHMNVASYVHLFDRATWAVFARVGIDDAYRARTHAGAFAVEQQVRHLAELREGDRVEVRSRVVLARPKSVRLRHAMIDLTHDRVAAIGEVAGVHVDLETRRARPFPPDVLARLEAEVEAHGGPVLDEASAARFARDWIDAWNRRDVEAVLAHYADDATFVSPKALGIVGRARLTNTADLRRYWQQGVERLRSLRFELDAAIWSAPQQTLTILYAAWFDDAPACRAVELLRFRGDRVIAGEALYGATVTW